MQLRTIGESISLQSIRLWLQVVATFSCVPDLDVEQRSRVEAE